MNNKKSKFRHQAYDFISIQLHNLDKYNMESGESFKKWINEFNDVEKVVFLYRGILDYKHDASINHLIKAKKYKKDCKFRKDVAKVYLKYISDYLFSLNHGIINLK